MKRPITFEEAKARYVHRYTMEHVPRWALAAPDSGVTRGDPVRPGYYAPQYRTDREWYEATQFPGEGGIPRQSDHCMSSGQTWPMGHWLAAPFSRVPA